MKTLNILLLIGLLFYAAKSQEIHNSQSDLESQFEEIHDSWDGKKLGSRYIYVYLKEDKFDLARLKFLSKSLSDKYPIPRVLTLKFFSNIDRLRKTIGYDNPGFSISWADTKEGREAQEKWDADRLPPKAGRYAEYFRRYDEEFLDIIEE